MKNEPVYYRDVDVDLSALRERLLQSLLGLSEQGFFRRAPRVVTEKDFESNQVLHTATYRYMPITAKKWEEVVGISSNI
jgi:hypothetical protein